MPSDPNLRPISPDALASLRVIGSLDGIASEARHMRCSGCGYITTDSRAATCCKGYCQDRTGSSCNSWPCPQCGRHHYWTGSVPAADPPVAPRIPPDGITSGTDEYAVYGAGASLEEAEQNARMRAREATPPRIPPDVLDDLRELTERPAAFVTISTSTLAVLLDAYEQVTHG